MSVLIHFKKGGHTLIVRVVWSVLVVSAHVSTELRVELVLLVETLLGLLDRGGRRVGGCWYSWLLLIAGTGVATGSVRVVRLSSSRVGIAGLAGLLLVKLLLLLLSLKVLLRLLTESTERRVVGSNTSGLLTLLLLRLRLLSGRFLRLRSVIVVSTLSVEWVLSVLRLRCGILRLLLWLLVLLLLTVLVE